MGLYGQIFRGDLLADPEIEGRMGAGMGGGVFGQIDVGPEVDPSRLKVVLYDPGRRALVAESSVTKLGGFEVRSAPAGMFELRVITLEGDVAYQTVVTVPSYNSMRIALRMPAATPASGGSISVFRLQHKVPKKALQAYAKAREHVVAQRREAAIGELEKALRLDPQFFEAANNVGVLYLQAGQLEKSFTAFQRAATIDPGDSLAESNLAYVLLHMQRFPEAEEAARASVRADGTSPRGHFFLALSLLEQRKGHKEAILHLTKVKDTFVPARNLLMQLKAEPKP
jgi:tetratricopeptide (TPR) repeat protein